MTKDIDLTPRTVPSDHARTFACALSTQDLARALHDRLARAGRRGQADAILVVLSDLLPEVDRDRLAPTQHQPRHGDP
jgi:hypothetical protein